MIDKVKNEVLKILDNDNSGHGMDHVNRVLDLSLRFAKNEKCDKEIVALIALLHDVDDYKLVGKECAEKLTNTNKILNNLDILENKKEQILSELNRFGYSKSLKGIRPQTIEGKIVSDADMCDALGVNGVLRSFSYNLKNGKPFFDRNIFPNENLTSLEYNKSCSHSVCHIFEKILKLKGLMMTSSGIKEAKDRHQIVIDILYHLFEEENTPEWKDYLDDYLSKQYQK